MSATLNNMTRVGERVRPKGELMRNQHQIESYNELRRAKSAFIPSRNRIVYQNWDEYKRENGDISPKFSPTRSNDVRATAGLPFSLVDTYRAADGTVYKQYLGSDHSDTILADYPTKNILHVPGKYHEHYRQWATEEEIPANLKHKFRSDQTRELLKDEIKVHDTLSKIYNAGMNRKHAKSDVESKETAESDQNAANYYDLSNHLRHSVSRGYPRSRRLSHKQEVHNLELSKEFFSDRENLESPYRRKKDWLLKWTEANIMRERIFKSLGAVEAEKAKTNTAS